MQLGTHEEILRTGSSFVDDYTLGLQFPACDFAGYFLFATLDGDGPCQALNLGLLVGSHDGRDLGFPALVGDAREVVVIRSLIHDGVSYRSPDDSSYTRGDVVYSRAGLDVQVADVARIRGRWPRFELFFVDPGFDIVYELTGTARYAHWVPDHVYSTMYSYVVFPEFAFQGTITVQGVAHDVSGRRGLRSRQRPKRAEPDEPRGRVLALRSGHVGGGRRLEHPLLRRERRRGRGRDRRHDGARRRPIILPRGALSSTSRSPTADRIRAWGRGLRRFRGSGGLGSRLRTAHSNTWPRPCRFARRPAVP